jgi:hypothetical protein
VAEYTDNESYTHTNREAEIDRYKTGDVEGSYMCSECDTRLWVVPCFKQFHTGKKVLKRQKARTVHTANMASFIAFNMK